MLPGDDKKYDIDLDPPPFDTSFIFWKTLNFMNGPLLGRFHRKLSGYVLWDEKKLRYGIFRSPPGLPVSQE